MRNISKIIWSEEALNNLREIIDYLEWKWSERELKKFAQKLENQIEIIKIYLAQFILADFRSREFPPTMI